MKKMIWVILIIFFLVPIAVRAAAEGQPCIENKGCDKGLKCNLNTGGDATKQVCIKPGAEGQPCIEDKGCGTGLKCNLNTGGDATKQVCVKPGALSTTPGITSLQNPINAENIPTLIGTIIKAALGVMGGLTLLMVVWGGSGWILAAGNPEKITSGKNTIVWALIGALLTVSSYVILNIVLKFYLSPQ